VHNERVFSAPSFSEVIKQLLIYRATGVLTIRRAARIRQEEVTITIERGHPKHVRWGMYEENANAAILAWFDTWGEIHFTFQVTALRLQLPAPAHNRETSRAPEHTTEPTQLRPGPSVTQALPTLPSRNRSNSPTSSRPPTRKVLKEDNAHSSTISTHNTSDRSDSRPSSPLPIIPPELAIPSLTANGQGYPITNLPRYDRTIFLLINGRRTLADLAHLTKRSPAEVYASLRRLQDLQVIALEA